MSQAEKAALWNELKAAGVTFDRHYREYTTEQLAEAVTTLRGKRGTTEIHNENAPAKPVITIPDDIDNPRPTTHQGPDTMAGIRQNTQDEDEPLRVDDQGRIWYQDEVRKPSAAKPRGRRILRYMGSNTKTVTVQNGQYLESFEVAGDSHTETEVKITLPSYQVGIYRDPRYPFKIHVYNEKRGFDLFEVQEFYGGSDLVPIGVKTDYVGNDLVYDIRTTVRAIETEYRERVLKQGKAFA